MTTEVGGRKAEGGRLGGDGADLAEADTGVGIVSFNLPKLIQSPITGFTADLRWARTISAPHLELEVRVLMARRVQSVETSLWQLLHASAVAYGEAVSPILNLSPQDWRLFYFQAVG